CLLDLLRERAPRLLCRAALDDMVRLAHAISPGTSTMAIQRLGRPRLDALIVELVRHGTPISDMRCVCQAIVEFTPTAAGPRSVVLGNAAASADEDTAGALLSFVRIRLGARIVAMLSDGEALLRAHLIDPAWAELAERDMSSGHGELLRAAIRRASPIGHGGSRWRIVLVVPLAVRALVADLLRIEFPHVTVVAFEEIPAWVTLEPISQHVGAPSARP
ncbi:MAG TPA: FHIPEP family type III secretion protein, partial [Kofleriaceae bacterium]